jgi:hypothetical protein
MMRMLPSSLAIAALAALSACGGGKGGTPSPATKLTYTDPSGGSYRLARNPASTPGHLVLDLVGPPSTVVNGVGFYLEADAGRVTWAPVSGTSHVASDFFTGPLLVCERVAGSVLQACIYRKGGVPAMTHIPLGVPSGKALILNPGTASTPTTPITIAIGTLIAE